MPDMPTDRADRHVLVDRWPTVWPTVTRTTVTHSCDAQRDAQLCENFLYVFKAARGAARAAATARTPALPLALPLRRRQRRSAGAKCADAGRLTYSKFHRRRRGVPAPAARIVRDRSEPVKAVCDRRGNRGRRAIW